MYKVLFIGDIVGRPGRNFVIERLPSLREELALDCVIANAENTAGLTGTTANITNDLIKAGVDGITLGDHVWDQRGFSDEIESLEFVCRPANLPSINPGKKHLVLEKNGLKVGVFTVLGRTFMKPRANCPFEEADRKILELEKEADMIICEIHAEATSEKIALGRYLDGRVAMVVGTHTHVTTADETILPRKTAYLTDVGMTGPHDSVLGAQVEIIVNQFLDGMPRRYEPAKGDVRISGALLTLDKATKDSISIERISIKQDVLDE